jgi:hypothetical protein
MRVSSWSSSSLTIIAAVLTTVVLAFGALASSCVRLSWQEGIACDGTSCPSGLGCCAGRCKRDCPADLDASAGDLGDAPADGAEAGGEDGLQDIAPSSDGEPSDGVVDDDASEPGDGAGGDGSSGLVCPPQGVGCIFCTPGCSCTTCGGVVTTCCLNQFNIATCGACP